MRNNSKLSSLLKDFEDVWGKGTEHLLNSEHREHFITFSTLLEGLQNKYPQFKTMVEGCEAQIFVSIPALVVLHNLKDIVTRFAPSLSIGDIVNEVKKSCKQPVIELDVLELASSGLRVAQRVKSAGMQLSRENSE